MSNGVFPVQQIKCKELISLAQLSSREKTTQNSFSTVLRWKHASLVGKLFIKFCDLRLIVLRGQNF